MNWFKTKYRILEVAVLLEGGSSSVRYMPQYRHWYSFVWCDLSTEPVTLWMDAANFITTIQQLNNATYL